MKTIEIDRKNQFFFIFLGILNIFRFFLLILYIDY